MNQNTQDFRIEPNSQTSNYQLSTPVIRGTQSSDMDGTFGVLGLGLLAGAVGIASMTLSDRSQRIRPVDSNEKVPAEKLEKLLRQPNKAGSGPWVANRAIHMSQGLIAKIFQPSFKRTTFLSAVPSFVFTGLRLSTDQMLENFLRLGPNKSLSKREQRVQFFYKAIYAFATGFFADLLLKSRQQARLIS